jgi:hypothetical protein
VQFVVAKLARDSVTSSVGASSSSAAVEVPELKSAVEQISHDVVDRSSSSLSVLENFLDELSRRRLNFIRPISVTVTRSLIDASALVTDAEGPILDLSIGKSVDRCNRL